MHTTLMVLHHVLAANGSTPAKKKSGGNYVIFVLVGIFALVYVFFLRPQRNRQRAALATRRVAEVGDEVTTTSGLIANVVAITDDYLTLEIAPGVHSRYVPAAILRVNSDEEPADDPDADDDATEAHDVSNHEVIEDPTAGGPTDGAGGPTDTPDEPAST